MDAVQTWVAKQKQQDLPVLKNGFRHAAQHGTGASLRGKLTVAGWTVSGTLVIQPMMQMIGRVIAAALGDQEQVHLGARVLQVRPASATEIAAGIL